MNLIFPLVLAAAAAAATVSHSVWDGVYSEEQAARGKKAFLAQCARCHGETLLGGEETRPLVDQDFLGRWNDRPVGLLVEITRLTMPSDGPGRLSRRQSTDLVAYLLSENGFPAGESDLKPTLKLLNQIQIESKK